MEFESLDTFFGYVDGEASRPKPKRLRCSRLFASALIVFILGVLKGNSSVAGGWFLATVGVGVIFIRVCAAFTTDFELIQDPACIRRIYLFLKNYVPADEEAFQELMQTVNSEGRFSYTLLERWYKREKFAVLHPKRLNRRLALRKVMDVLKVPVF